MQSLLSISLTHYRNYTYQNFDFSAPVVGITGLNGSGKTNLLDAIYYLCYTKSYFQNREANNVQNGKNGFRIEGKWSDDEKVSTVTCIWKEGKKIVLHNDSEYEKLSEHIGKYHAVMIAPDDIGLINDSSEGRRKFIDGILSQNNTQYLNELLQYNKILLQRNAYLKQAMTIDHSLMDIYDAQLANAGSYLMAQRQKLTSTFPNIVQSVYAFMSGNKEAVGIEYKSTCSPLKFCEKLYDARPRDMDYKRTTIGPHTEDWQFIINQNLIKTHASQGQKKSFLIALKLAHIQYLHSFGKYPILLLDDIFEKLDKERVLRLFEWIKNIKLPQIFITHTDESELAKELKNIGIHNQMINLG